MLGKQQKIGAAGESCCMAVFLTMVDESFTATVSENPNWPGQVLPGSKHGCQEPGLCSNAFTSFTICEVLKGIKGTGWKPKLHDSHDCLLRFGLHFVEFCWGLLAFSLWLRWQKTWDHFRTYSNMQSEWRQGEKEMFTSSPSLQGHEETEQSYKKHREDQK